MYNSVSSYDYDHCGNNVEVAVHGQTYKVP